jgi:hypothetical protein
VKPFPFSGCHLSGRNSWLVFAAITLILFTRPAAAQSNPGGGNAAYTWTTFAGSSPGGSADGVGGNARFNQPFGVAVDTNGNVFVTDFRNNEIRKVTSAGVVTTIAGLPGIYGSDDGIGRNARFFNPCGIALDKAGNLYVADYFNSMIRRLTPVGTNWSVTTIAGQSGSYGSADGTGTNAQFTYPNGVAVDNGGNVFVTDQNNHTVRKLTPSGPNWVVSTIAGTAGVTGTNDGLGGVALFNQPAGIAVDSASNLFVVDGHNYTIRKLTRSGTNWLVSTFAGKAGLIGSTDGVGLNAQFNSPWGVDVDSAGNLFVGDAGNGVIRKITPAGAVTNFAGQVGGSGNADGTGINAQFAGVLDLALDAAGNIYVADLGNNEIRKVTSAGVVKTLAGSAVDFINPGNVDGTGTGARFYQPYGMAADGAGNIYVADYANCTIRQISPAGVVSTMAGSQTNYGSADGAGDNASFYTPKAVAVNSTGTVFVADGGNHTIRKITPAGVVTTIAGLAGNGNSGSADGTNSTARFGDPFGITLDSGGNLYVADRLNETIRMIRPVGTNWVVRTIAGLTGSAGHTDGTNSAARFYDPRSITADSATNLYVADFGNNLIRKIQPVGTNWVVSTIAGNYGSSGHTDGTGTNATFYAPEAIDVDSAGNLYVVDGSTLIRKITPTGTNWSVTTIGGGVSGNADGAGSAAQFYNPFGITVDNSGIVYVADTFNNTIRKGVFTAFADYNLAYTAPPMNGALRVTLLPPEAGGQWRFGWEQNWRPSGTTASSLAQGNYPVVFRTLPGYLLIQTTTNFTVAVTNGGTTTITNQYYPTLGTVDTNSGGSLTINIGPSAPGGAGWRFLGDTTPYYPSGYTTNLVAGTYLIGFAPVSGFATPPSIAVQISAGLPVVLWKNYLLADAPPASGVLLPFPVPASQFTNLVSYPFGFNGQLQTDVGYGSGVAVQAKVVLTAAHILFNDQTLSYVSQAYWYFRQETNLFATQPPQVARGWLVLSGYAAQRTNDLGGLGGQTYGADESSPQSRSLDVAALYFDLSAAGGGYGGYLSSDDTPNTWLTGNSLKMLAGYPVDGSLLGNAAIMPGVLYQTQPQPYTFSPDIVPQVYTAPWFLSYPGNSGGPVYAQFNGYYYPAAVYLGTVNNGAYQSVVRAIDSAVVNLITNAQALADGGANHGGGGVLTIIPNQAISASNPGYLQFQLGPPAAVAAGVGWRLQGDSAYSSATNYTRAVLSTNAFAVEFKPVAGWQPPPNQAVNVTPGNIASYAAFYSVTNPILVASGAALGITGTTGTVYRIERRSSLTSGTWQPVSTNTISSGGFNLFLANPTTNGSVNFYRAVWLP